MKLGPRKPNLKKRFKARTSGKLKRQAKKAVNPFYGKKGMGLVKDPKRSLYNKVYHKTTFDVLPPLDPGKKSAPSPGKKRTSSPGKKSIQKLEGPKKERAQLLRAPALEEAFYFTETLKIQRKHKGPAHILIGTVVGFALLRGLGAILGSLVAYGLVRRHNKKPTLEYREVTKNLSESEISDLLEDLSARLESHQRSLSRLEGAKSPEVFFNQLKASEDKLYDLNHLVAHYHVPDPEGDIKDLVRSFPDLKEALVLDFIASYYEKEEEKASSLKTERGYNNRMAAKKEALLAHEDFLTQDHLALIQTLWSSGHFKK
ncbi:MAG: hypothetical protein Q4E37_06395 [Tissierellia bacterium]|nr:hypothetical protein [Tissierellia bacterium]